MFRDEVKCSASATTKLHLFVKHSSFVPFVYFYEPSFFSLFLPFFLRHDRNTSGSMERYEQVRAVKVFHRGAPLPVVYDHDHDDEDDTPRREREIAVATEYKLIC